MDAYIVVISTLAKSEKGINLEKARLNEAFSILTTVKGVNPDNIVTATSNKKADGLGRIDFFLGGELFLRSFAKPGRNICLQ